MIIYEWYYNVPAVKWPTGYYDLFIIFFFICIFLDAGFRVGTDTVYRYVVIHMKYFQSDINDIYGQQITIMRRRYSKNIYFRNNSLLFIEAKV